MNRNLLLHSLALLSIMLLFACSDSGVEPPPATAAIVVGDVTVTEGVSADFAVTLTKAADGDVTLNYTTTNGSATAGTDYTALPLTADTIPMGSTSIVVSVATIDNVVVDGSRTFSLVVSSVVGANVQDAIGVATINDDEISPVSYSTQVQPILSSRCAISGCHGNGFSSGGFTMANGAPFNIVRNAVGNNGSIIVSGSASSSSLYSKTTSSPPFGTRMPQTGGFLSISDQNLIRDWVNEGAQDN